MLKFVFIKSAKPVESKAGSVTSGQHSEVKIKNCIKGRIIEVVK